VGEAAVAAHLAHGDSLGACPQACGIPAAVPKTGQTRCWGSSGPGPYDFFPIDCAGTGQDGEYQKGVSVDPRFTDNADGTVKDNLTGLIWLKDANCFGLLVWYDALTLSNTLASGACGLTDGSVAGDWRLPNVKELESLLDRGRTPAVPIAHPFSGVENYNYWSSTTAACCMGYAWNVNLLRGEVINPGYKRWAYYVWPVRDGQ
jgi:hypothetical protein